MQSVFNASTIQDMLRLISQVYCGGPKRRLPQWLRANCEVIITTTIIISGYTVLFTFPELNSEQCLSYPNYRRGSVGAFLLLFLAFDSTVPNKVTANRNTAMG